MELVTQVADNVFYNPAYKVVTIDGIPALEVPQCPGYYLTQEGKLWNPVKNDYTTPYFDKSKNTRIVEVAVSGKKKKYRPHLLLEDCFACLLPKAQKVKLQKVKLQKVKAPKVEKLPKMEKLPKPSKPEKVVIPPPEGFVPIKDYPDYWVSPEGSVWSDKSFGLLKNLYTKQWRACKVRLYTDGEWKMKPLHRLVAQAFLPNPRNLGNVMRRNMNPFDNRPENLYWAESKIGGVPAINKFRIKLKKTTEEIYYRYRFNNEKVLEALLKNYPERGEIGCHEDAVIFLTDNYKNPFIEDLILCYPAMLRIKKLITQEFADKAHKLLYETIGILKDYPSVNIRASLVKQLKSRFTNCTLHLENVPLSRDCPLSGLPIKYTANPTDEDSPIISVLDTSKGILKGNIQVIRKAVFDTLGGIVGNIVLGPLFSHPLVPTTMVHLHNKEHVARLGDSKSLFIKENGLLVGIYANGQSIETAPNTPNGLKHPAITFILNGRHVSKRVDFMVATLFLPKPESCPHIIHINGNNSDCRVNNLEWCSLKAGVRNTKKYDLKEAGRKHVWKVLHRNKFKFNYEPSEDEVPQIVSLCHAYPLRLRSMKSIAREDVERMLVEYGETLRVLGRVEAYGKKNSAGYISDPRTNMVNQARVRTRDYNLPPCEIKTEDVLLPENCPLLGMPLVYTHTVAQDNSASIDKIVPALGYIKGNIQVLSNMANRMKSNANEQDLLTFAENLIKMAERKQEEKNL